MKKGIFGRMIVLGGLELKRKEMGVEEIKSKDKQRKNDEIVRKLDMGEH